MSASMNPPYIFTNAQKMAHLHPATFYAPSKEELNALKVDSIVKVCHDFHRSTINNMSSERFWATITKIHTNGKITAIVNNDLINTMYFDYGSEIIFKKENIYQIFE